MHARAARRYLLGAAITPVALGALVFAALAGPWSPFALDDANARYTTGDITGAEQGYVALIESWRAPDTRAEAATRAGLLALGRGDTRTAADRLRRAVDLQPDAARRAEVRAQLASVYRDQLADPVRAAEEFERAGSESSRARPILEAARCWELAGKADRALAAWTRAAGHAVSDVERAEADAGLGRAERAFSALVDAAR